MDSYHICRFSFAHFLFIRKIVKYKFRTLCFCFSWITFVSEGLIRHFKHEKHAVCFFFLSKIMFYKNCKLFVGLMDLFIIQNCNTCCFKNKWSFRFKHWYSLKIIRSNKKKKKLFILEKENFKFLFYFTKKKSSSIEIKICDLTSVPISPIYNLFNFRSHFF